MTKIKICGLKRAEDISYVNELLPDFAGFVFAKSSRQVDAEKASMLKALLSPGIRAVGVFVNAAPEFIADLYRKKVIDIAQLHGDEDIAYIDSLKERCPKLPLIKAVRVQSAEQISEAEKLPCDFLLLDTWQKDSYGGSGKTFDRSLIPPLTKPWFLAGGLNAENIAESISQCHPWAVDVSSAVETDEVKDREKIRDFILAVRTPEALL